LAGCSDPAQSLIRKVAARVTNAPWHELHGWKAADFFTDPQVIALCDAIAANDVARMKERIAAGADVNARGKGNMTPLLWAFVDNKPERFRLLLEAGANPNVYIESDFGIRQAFSRRDPGLHRAQVGRGRQEETDRPPGGSRRKPEPGPRSGGFAPWNRRVVVRALRPLPSASRSGSRPESVRGE
jgi:ankyrin repeat protein